MADKPMATTISSRVKPFWLRALFTHKPRQMCDWVYFFQIFNAAEIATFGQAQHRNINIKLYNTGDWNFFSGGGFKLPLPLQAQHFTSARIFSSHFVVRK